MTPVRVFALVLFFVSMLPIACVPTIADPEPSIDQNNLSNTTTSYPAPTTEFPDNEPIPSKELDSYPAPVPTKDQQPIVTPWPSPVRKEQPTPTALPLRPLSDNTSGDLYLIGSKNNSISEIYVASVSYDETVALETQHKLPEVQLRSSYPPRLFPSPDNKMLAVIESSEHGPADIITVINLRQGAISPFGNNRDPEMPFLWRFGGWHPDGRHFLISDADRFKGLWLVDSFGINAPLKLTEHSPDTVAFSPTGQVLAYAYRPKLSDQSLLVFAWHNGSNPEVIAQMPIKTPITELSWSADGTALAYVVGGTELWLYKQGKQVQLVNDYKARYGYTWSPDSRFIAYVARTAPDELPLTDASDLERLMYSLKNTMLHIIDTQTSEISIPKYDSETTGAFTPSWTPNGQNVLYIAIQSGNFAIMQVNLNTFNTVSAEKIVFSESSISAAVWVEFMEEK